MYFGEVTDPNIRHIFRDAGDFIVRPLKCGKFTLYAYAIDGLTSGADTSEYVIKPITDNLRGDTVQALYTSALRGRVYNSVADPCRDLDTVARKLVNGFCVVLFPGAGVQYQPHPPPSAHPGSAALGDPGGPQEPDQCDCGLH